jgi:hypothetical protein
MEIINNYMYNVFLLMKKKQNNGEITQYREYKIHKEDLKILKNIYNIYKIYRFKITFNEFLKTVKENTLSNRIEIIKSGLECAELIEKIMNK